MRTISLSLDSASGRTLATTIYASQDASRKLLPRGHVLGDSDVNRLRDEGVSEVPCAEMEDGDIGELEAATAVAERLVCGYARLEIGPAGRINIMADADCCVIIDHNILDAINQNEDVSVATLRHFTFAAKDQRIATVKSRHFAARASAVQEVVDVLSNFGQAIQARPIDARVVVIYSDLNDRYRAQKLFEGVLVRRLQSYGIRRIESITTLEKNIAQALNAAFRLSPTLVLIASSTAPAGPEDLVGLGMKQAGVTLERFMAPVEPGNMLLLGYSGDTAVMSAPTCWRSAAPNVVDYMLPPLLSRYRVSRAEISMLGHGGLLG